MSVPSSAHTCTAYRLGGWPRTACTPAETTSISLRFPISRRKTPSAIGLRQMLPVQTKRTFFTVRNEQRARYSNLEVKLAKSISSVRAERHSVAISAARQVQRQIFANKFVHNH